ncbi:MAG TPA: TadE family type IV pilus minor pilin [Gryllotalpicola sp.]
MPLRSEAEPTAAGHDLRRVLGGERGTVTAEFAVVLPGVLLVLALCLGAVNVVAQQLTLGSLAASGARMLARGDDPAAMQARLVAAAPGVTVARSSDGGFVCVALERHARFGPLGAGALELSAHGCALAADPLPVAAGSVGAAGAGP